MLKVSSLSFSYNKNSPILEDVNFSLEKNSITALVGKNGSGKTTLIKLIMNFLKPTSGSVIINDKDNKNLNEKERATLCSYIPQLTSDVFPMSVFDYVLLGRASTIPLFSSPNKKDKECAKKNIKKLGLERIENKLTSQISGGEKQLALIARALTQNSNLLLLDEITSALDFSNQIIILNTLTSLKTKGYTVLYSTHNPEHALNFSDNILILDNKKCTLYPPDALIDNPKILSDLYGINLYIKRLDYNNKRRVVCLPL